MMSRAWLSFISASFALVGCDASSLPIDVVELTPDTFSSAEKSANQQVVLSRLSSHSEGEIKDCVAAMETAESMAKSNPDSGLDFNETQNMRLFWMEALSANTGENEELGAILSTSNFHLGQAEMSRSDSAKFQDDLAKGCVLKMANALREIGVSTGYEN